MGRSLRTEARWRRLDRILALGVLVLIGCTGDQPPPVQPNVILVVVDTLRADHLGTYGYERGTSARLDRFATDAVVFEHAVAQASCTYPSANSILTGRWTFDFLGQPNGFQGIPDHIPSLAEIYRQNGYSTAAVSSSPIVRKTPSKFNKIGGFGKGFDLFDESCHWRSAACVNREALKALDQLEEPFFLYLHYLDPHSPYRPPETWDLAFADPKFDGDEAIAAGSPDDIAAAMSETGEIPPLGPNDLDHLIDLYDDEIGYFDAVFEHFIRRLVGRGLLDRSIVMIGSDHGESFLEHGQIKHCKTVYQSEIHTPLIVRLPEGDSGRRIGRPVQNLSITPTLLDLAGIDPEPYEFDGASLRPLLEGGEPPEAYGFSAWAALRSVRQGRLKLIYHLREKTYELYDLASDPGETVNLVDDRPDDFRRLKRALFAWIIEYEGPDSDRSAEQGEEVQEQLRALGYLQ